MHELGINEPRLVSFARSLAASGFFVMTPQVQGLADYRVEAESAAVIGAPRSSSPSNSTCRRLASWGSASPAGLRWLRLPIRTIATRLPGSRPSARTTIWRTCCASSPPAKPSVPTERFEQLYAARVRAADRRARSSGRFLSATRRHQSYRGDQAGACRQGKKSEALTAQMTPAGQEMMQRIYHKQFDSFRQAILAEIDKDREQLAAASPAGRLRFLHAPVLLLHGSDDTVIPPTELLWLKQKIPQEYLLDALVSPAISHVDVGHKASFREQFALVHWMAELIRLARNAPTCSIGGVARRSMGALAGDMVRSSNHHGDPRRHQGSAAEAARHRGAHAAGSLLPSGGEKRQRRSMPTGCGELWLKPESLQPIGSFKLRGAYNKIASLSESERAERRHLVFQRQPCARRGVRSAGVRVEVRHRDAAQCAEDQG